jgi:hypothetical protein
MERRRSAFHDASFTSALSSWMAQENDSSPGGAPGSLIGTGRGAGGTNDATTRPRERTAVRIIDPEDAEAYP